MTWGPQWDDWGHRRAGEFVTGGQVSESGGGGVRGGNGEWNARGDDAPVGAHVRVTGAEGAVLLVEALT